MTYEEVKNYALQLINQYSIAGETIDLDYNDQADYENKIPLLVNDALMYIATSAKPITAYTTLDDLESEEFGTGFTKFTLPSDAWQLSSRGLYQTNGKYLRRFNHFHFIGEKEIIIPNGMVNLADTVVEYYRYPTPLTIGSSGEPTPTQTLDGEPETHTVVAYYVASHLIMYDDSFRYSALQNEFETKLSRLTERRVATYEPVTDVYSGNPYSGWSDGYGG